MAATLRGSLPSPGRVTCGEKSARVEGAGHVCHPDAESLIDAAQQHVVAGHGHLAEPGKYLAGQAVAPFGECGQVVVHRDDAGVRVRLAQRGQDRREVGGCLGDGPARAGRELHDREVGDTRIGVIRPDVQGDQCDPGLVRADEPDGRGQLRPARVRADAAMDHGHGGLSGTAELDQAQARLAAVQRCVELVRVSVRGADAGTRRVGLHALGQRVAQRQVIADRRPVVLRGCRPLRRRPGTAAGRGADHARQHECEHHTAHRFSRGGPGEQLPGRVHR